MSQSAPPTDSQDTSGSPAGAEAAESIDAARRAGNQAVAASIRAVRDAISTTQHSIAENWKFVQQLEQTERSTSQDAILLSSQALRDSMSVLKAAISRSFPSTGRPSSDGIDDPKPKAQGEQIASIIQADMQRIRSEHEAIMKVFQQASATLSQAYRVAPDTLKPQK